MKVVKVSGVNDLELRFKPFIVLRGRAPITPRTEALTPTVLHKSSKIHPTSLQTLDPKP